MHRSPRSRVALVALAVVASPLVPSLAGAQLAPGTTLVLTGAADAVDIGSAGVLLSFLAPVRVDAASTGAFAPLAGGTATLAPITVGNGAQNAPGVVRAGGFTFDLQSIPSGGFGQADCYVAPAAGQQCTPYQLPSYELSPFYLANVATGTEGVLAAFIAFDVRGTVTANGTTSSFTGTIASTFVGVSYQEALFALEQTGLQGVPFTGTFVVGAPTVSVTPEPATLALVGGGLAALGLVVGRRRR